MPKKANKESQADQSERFKRDAQRLIDAGELDPIEADERIKDLLAKRSAAVPRSPD